MQIYRLVTVRLRCFSFCKIRSSFSQAVIALCLADNNMAVMESLRPLSPVWPGSVTAASEEQLSMKLQTSAVLVKWPSLTYSDASFLITCRAGCQPLAVSGKRSPTNQTLVVMLKYFYIMYSIIHTRDADVVDKHQCILRVTSDQPVSDLFQI